MVYVCTPPLMHACSSCLACGSHAMPAPSPSAPDEPHHPLPKEVKAREVPHSLLKAWTFDVKALRKTIRAAAKRADGKGQPSWWQLLRTHDEVRT